MDNLIRNLSEDQRKRLHAKVDEPLSISIFTTRTNVDQSTTKLNFKFIYHNLFLESLLRMKPTNKDKHELMIRCYELYKNNPSELAVVHEFDHEYQSNKALWWYTRETFLFRLLNKGLRTQNIDLLFCFRFFLSDLQKQIEDHQCQQRMEIYRAQLMSIEELNELKNSIGEYISINSFFSTSRDRNYALFLLGDLKSVYDDFHQKVLFQIDADPTHAGVKAFADISVESDFKNECEVLIMLGAVFRLENIYSTEQNIWIIDLTLTNCDDCQLKNPIDPTKDIDLFTFGKLLHQMNKFDEAEKYFRRLLKEFANDVNQTSLCYYHIGRVYSSRRKPKDAIIWYDKTLKTMMEFGDFDKLNLADCYNSIGNIHRRQENYRVALQFYEKALHIWKEEYGDDHLKIAMCLINIGVIYDFEEHYDQALECLEKALLIKEKYQENNQSDIAILYNNIGLVHQHARRFDLALENFQQALNIYQTLSHEQNQDYAITLEYIGHVLEQMEHWTNALSSLKEAASIYRQVLSSEHRKVTELEQDIQHISVLINKHTTSE